MLKSMYHITHLSKAFTLAIALILNFGIDSYGCEKVTSIGSAVFNSDGTDLLNSNVIPRNAIKFSLNQGGGTNDCAVFRVSANSTFGFDNDMDALKEITDANSAHLYIMSDDFTKYALSTVPTINSDISIPLNMECVSKNVYTISVNGGLNFEYRYPLMLEDKQLNKFIDLRSDTVYSFVHSPEMKTDRFLLHFNVAPQDLEKKGMISVENAFAGEVKITGNDDKMYMVNMYTMDGRLVASAKGVLSEGIKIQTNNKPSGIVILKIFNKEHAITQKVYTK